jgi:hypothetical protein
MKFIKLQKARDKQHKYVAKVLDDNNRMHSIPFGAYGMSDYTLHRDSERRSRYINRHKKRENWGLSGRLSAGFFSYHLLWGPSTSLTKNIELMKKKFYTKKVTHKSTR